MRNYAVCHTVLRSSTCLFSHNERHQVPLWRQGIDIYLITEPPQSWSPLHLMYVLAGGATPVGLGVGWTGPFGGGGGLVSESISLLILPRLEGRFDFLWTGAVWRCWESSFTVCFWRPNTGQFFKAFPLVIEYPFSQPSIIASSTLSKMLWCWYHKIRIAISALSDFKMCAAICWAHTVTSCWCEGREKTGDQPIRAKALLFTLVVQYNSPLTFPTNHLIFAEWKWDYGRHLGVLNHVNGLPVDALYHFRLFLYAIWVFAWPFDLCTGLGESLGEVLNQSGCLTFTFKYI